MTAITPLYLNNVSSVVQAGSSAIGSSTATGVNVASGDGANFGAIGTNQYIPAVVLDTSTTPETVKEYVYITARATDALTVVRQAQDSARYPASTTTIQAGFTIAAAALGQDLTDSWRAGGGDIFASGNYSHGLFASAAASTLSLTLNSLRARPFWVPVRRAFDRIGINVTTAASAGSGGVLRMGIYNSAPGAPGSLLLDAGTAGSESTGAKEITIAQTLGPGVYWLAVVAQVATCSVTSFAAATATPWGSGDTAPPSSFSNCGYSQSLVSGALPDPMVPNNVTAFPVVVLRAA